MHQTFTELSVEGAAPAEVVRQAARMAGRPVVLENLAHQVLAYDAAGTDADVAAARLGGPLARAVRIPTPDRLRPGRRAGSSPPSAPAARTGAGSCWSPPTGRQRRATRCCSSAARPPLALNRLVERDRESLERQTHRTLLHRTCWPHSCPVGDVALRAQALGVPLEGRALVARGAAAHRGAGRAGARGAGAAAGLRRERRERGTRRTALAVVGAIDDSSVGVLLSLPLRVNVDPVLERLSTALSQQGASGRSLTGSEDWMMAVGSVVPAPRDARRSFLEAMQVADAAPAGASASHFYRLPDVRLRGLLHLLRDDARLQTYVERELGPLLAYDAGARSGSELVGVLRTYLEVGRNKSAAADAAHLSPAGLLRAAASGSRRVLGVDLDDVETCLSLHVALLALDALRRHPS